MKRALFILLVCFFCGSCTYTYLHSPLGILGAGSYPYVELYNLKAAKPEAIKAVQDFKAAHEEHIPPPFLDEKDSLQAEEDHQGHYWYEICFFDPEENVFYYAGLDHHQLQARPGMSELAFIGIARYNRDTRRLGKFHKINLDFELEENQRCIRRFKKLFVEPLKEILSPKS